MSVYHACLRQGEDFSHTELSRSPSLFGSEFHETLQDPAKKVFVKQLQFRRHSSRASDSRHRRSVVNILSSPDKYITPVRYNLR